MEQMDSQIKLGKLLKDRGFIKDEVIGFILGLETEENAQKMLTFLEEHPEYGNPKGRNKIFRRWYEIQNKTYPSDTDEDDEWEEEEESEDSLKLEKDEKLF